MVVLSAEAGVLKYVWDSGCPISTAWISANEVMERELSLGALNAIAWGAIVKGEEFRLKLIRPLLWTKGPY